LTRSRTQKSDLTDAEYRKLAAFRQALRGFVAFSAAEAEAIGLTPRQHQVLLAIRGWPDATPPNIKSLAERMMIRHNSAVGLIQRLETAGFIQRIESVGDRRFIQLSLTPKGEAALAALSASHLAELRQRGPRLVEMLQALIFG
jgi:DNA-binding MarR family transcriptional regulator